VKIIGITGNYGAGKSTIASLFQKFNCYIIDLDKLGHEILETNQFKKKMVQVFGKYVLEHDKISREKLRKIVFYNPEYLMKLNRIIHPELISRLKKEIKKYQKSHYKALIVDAALIFELKIQEMMDIIITVCTNQFISYLRLLRKRKISFCDFKNIFNSQMSLKMKMQNSDYIIYNNLPVKLNYKRIIKIIEKVLS